MSDSKKTSDIVTVFAVIGLVFGLISLFGSFIPCFGILALYIGIPATIISAIGLIVAIKKNAKRTFIISSLTISLIGVAISNCQLSALNSFGKKMSSDLKEASKEIEKQQNPQP